MTEAGWLACTDSYSMLNPLEGHVSDRKCYLYSIACLRRIHHLLTDERCRKLVDVSPELWNGGGLLCSMLSPKVIEEGVQHRFAELLFAA